MQELTKALKSVSSDLLDRFIDSVYKFSEQPYLNEVNIKIVNVCMCYYIICKHDIVQHQICEVDEQLFFPSPL